METVGGGSNSSDDQRSPGLTSSTTLQESAAQLRQTLAAIGGGGDSSEGGGGGIGSDPAVTSVFNPSTRSPKRRRIDTDDVEMDRFQPPSCGALPPDDLVDSLVDIYFERIHPWIPMLHVTRFRRDMSDPNWRQTNYSILHAMVSLCARFSNDARLADPEVCSKISKKSREIVILQSMESFSVVNLQALVICAFETVRNSQVFVIDYQEEFADTFF